MILRKNYGMPRLLVLAIILMHTVLNGMAQAPEWQTTQQYGADSYEFVNKVKTDVYGNRYLLGMYKDTTQLGAYAFSASPWLVDMFIAKTDPNGNVLWAHHTNTTGIAMGADLAIDGNGNCYITGYFRWDAHFGSVSFTDSIQIRPRVMYLSKIDASGNFAWTLIEQNVSSAGTSLATDAAGNVFLTGFYESEPPGSTNPGFSFAGLTAPAANPWWAVNLFTAKINPEGHGQWIKIISTNGALDTYFNTFHPTGKSLQGSSSTETDAAGNIYVSSSFVASSVTAGNQTFTYPAFSDSVYRVLLVKYSDNGTQQWAKAWSGIRDISLTEMIPDALGNIYVTGMVKGQATIEGTPVNATGNLSSYIARFTTHGSLEWVHTVTGTKEVQVMGLALDDYGHAYMAGWSTGSASINGQISSAAADKYNDWIIKYAPNGHLSWGLTTPDAGVSGLTMLTTGEVLVALYFQDPISLANQTFYSNGIYGDIDIIMAILSSTLTGLPESTNSVAAPIALYPNPSSGSFSVEGHQISSVQVLNVLGQIVHQQKASLGPIETVSLKGQPNGLYLVQVVSDGKLYNKQIVLQR